MSTIKKVINMPGLDMSHDWVEIYSGHLECSKCGVFQAEDAPPVGYPCPGDMAVAPEVEATTRPMEYSDIVHLYDQLSRLNTKVHKYWSLHDCDSVTLRDQRAKIEELEKKLATEKPTECESPETETVVREHPLLGRFRKAVEDGKLMDLVIDNGWHFCKIVCDVDAENVYIKDVDADLCNSLRIERISGIRTHRAGADCRSPEADERSYIVANDPLMQDTNEVEGPESEPGYIIYLESVEIEAKRQGRPQYRVRCDEAGRQMIDALPDLLRAAELTVSVLSINNNLPAGLKIACASLERALEKAGIEI